MEHNKTFSIFKALGILLILTGHTALKTPLFTFTYLFHIPLFFFVAGYFFNDAFVERPLEFLRKKLIRLYVPWLAYGLLFVLLHNLFLQWNVIAYDFHAQKLIEPYSLGDMLHKSLGVLTFFVWKEPLLAPLWFLFGLFSGLCVYFVVTWISKRLFPKHPERCRAILMLLCMSLGFIGNAYHFHLSLLYRPMVIAGLMYIGTLYRLFQARIRLSPWGAVACFLVLLVATTFKYEVNVGAMLFGNPFLFLTFACAGCYLTLWLSQHIQTKTTYLRAIFDFIGQYTFSIMALQYLAFKLAALLQIWACGYPIRYLAYYPVIPKNTHVWWVVYTLIGLVVPLFLGYAVKFLTLRIKKSS